VNRLFFGAGVYHSFVYIDWIRLGVLRYQCFGRLLRSNQRPLSIPLEWPIERKGRNQYLHIRNIIVRHSLHVGELLFRRHGVLKFKVNGCESLLEQSA